ncbi:MAG: hypothetical protein RL277_1412 [Planctomycetota bacterium]
MDSERQRSGFLGFVTTRPVAITMLMIAIGVFGAVSFSKLRLDLLPEISYPTLTVRTTYSGAAPEDIEDRVSERIQEALSTLPRVVRTTSLSRAETSDVMLDFEWGTAMSFAVQDVRDRLDSVVLPREASRPLILRYDPNLDPILRIAVTLPAARSSGSERDLIQLRWLAEKRIQRELETIPGIAAVQVRGGLEEEIRIRVDPFKLAAQDIDPAVLAARLGEENLNASGGLIREGSSEFLVRTLNEFVSIEEIADLAIVRRGEAVIRVRDVAEVERTHARRELITRLDDREAVEIAVYREAGENIVALAERVKERLFGTPAQQELARRFGTDGAALGFGEREQLTHLAHVFRRDARFELLSDQSTFIRSAIEDVQSSAVMGALLAMAVIWFALRRIGPTLIIGVSIPLSVLVTFAPMYLGDVTLNLMSLGGLALGIGMLVDNSIVVLEAITQQREKGLSMLDAAREGAREVAAAISGSTLTTVAVFAPIIFVHGIAGRIFGDQALTVVTSLLVSLLVAVMFIPMLASRQFGIAAASTAAAGPAASLPAAGTQGDASGAARWLGVGQIWGVRIFAWLSLLIAWILRGLGFVLGRLLAPLHWLHDKAYHAVERGYVSLLARSLRSPWKIVLIATGVSAIALTRVGSLGLDLLPEVHQGEFTAWVSLDVGTPLARTDDAMRRIEREVRGIDGVELTALTVGVEPDTLSREIEGKHTARLTVRLRQDRVNEAEEERAVAAVRAVFAREPLVRSVDIKRSTPFALEAPVEVEVLGYDLARIEAVAADVQRRMAGIEGLSDVRTTSRPGFPEARIRFDRDKVLEYGLDLRAVSTLVRDQVLGNVSTRFNEGDDRIDVRVIGDEAVLSSLDRVLDLEVNPAASNPVPLSAIASVETLAGPAEIRRIGNTRAVVVSAESSGLDLGNMAAKIAAALDGMKTPDDVLVQIGGQKREMEAAQSSMRFALILALFLVYAVMACLFESLVQPLIVMITAPLAAVGVVYTLDCLDIPLSVIVFIGLILLAGIVVNNAIVLLERTNQLRETGLSVLAAQEETCRTRLRPIYMTTATTVLGLLPMTGWLGGIPGLAALGAGEGAELREPLAITVIAGLSVSTLLTLLVVPCLYQIVYGRKQRS